MFNQYVPNVKATIAFGFMESIANPVSVSKKFNALLNKTGSVCD
jgi:hypothetical protein